MLHHRTEKYMHLQIYQLLQGFVDFKAPGLNYIDMFDEHNPYLSLQSSDDYTDHKVQNWHFQQRRQY